VNPANAHALAFSQLRDSAAQAFYSPDDFVSGDNRKRRRWCLAFDLVEFPGRVV
jgi:hypothetical protein